jgi:8-oxo-dGTP pyrophosphatase MutT (NUDIX family)
MPTSSKQGRKHHTTSACLLACLPTSQRRLRQPPFRNCFAALIIHASRCRIWTFINDPTKLHPSPGPFEAAGRKMLHPLYRAQLLLALLPEWTGALVPVPGGNRPGRPSGHVISGVSIAGAGVVPYVDLPGRGIHFLLQGLTNGTRAGKLSDFGGRREEGDNDALFTAARELCEETGARARPSLACRPTARDDSRRPRARATHSSPHGLTAPLRSRRLPLRRRGGHRLEPADVVHGAHSQPARQVRVLLPQSGVPALSDGLLGGRHLGGARLPRAALVARRRAPRLRARGTTP